MAYFGFKTESSLRNALVDYLEDVGPTLDEHERPGGATPVAGYGASSFPNLIVCHDLALIKMNGMPYGAPIVDNLSIAPKGDQDGWWPFYGSTRDRSGLLLLETLWTKLRNHFDIPHSIFGEDLTIDAVNPLLFAKPVPKVGWKYVECRMTESSLRRAQDEQWEPVFITETQAAAIAYIGSRDELDLEADTEFRQWLCDSGADLSQFVRDLVSTGLIFVDADRRLRLLTYQCATAFLPDGRIAAGENVTGRLVRWTRRLSRGPHGASVEDAGPSCTEN